MSTVELNVASDDRSARGAAGDQLVRGDAAESAAESVAESPASSTPPAKRAADATTTGPTPAPRQTIQFIHLLRAIAPLLVLWGHLSGYWLYMHGQRWSVQDAWSATIAKPLRIDAGHLGVVVFFLVSGYIVSYTSLKEGRREFGIKRVLRIFPMLGVALAVTFVCRRVNEAFHAGALPGVGLGGIRNYVKSFLLVDNLASPGVVLGQTWTLKIEILFYLATLLLLGYSRRSPLRATWVMFGGWVVVNLILFAQPGIRDTMLSTVYVGFLIFGRTLYLAHSQKISKAEGVTLALTTGTFFVLIYSSVFPGELLRELNPNAASMAVAIVAFIALMQAPIRRLPGPVRFLGDISYSLYLLHIPVGMLVLNIAHKMGAHHTAAFLAATAASLAASYVGYRLVEIPAQRLARRLSPERRHTQRS